MTGTARLRIENAVAWVSLHNPARRNALDSAMSSELVSALERADADPGVGVIILTGAGDDFCAGADVSERASGVPSDAGDPVARAERALTAVSKPVVAAVSGSCIGAGVALLLACDIAVADSTARLAVTASRLGIVYPASALERLVARVRPPVALRMLYTGQTLDAAAALAAGLVDELGQDARDTAGALAERMTGNSLLSMCATKNIVAAIRENDPERARLRAEHWHELAASSGETAEGLRAFAERRPPAFPWRPTPSAP